jgi:hypothetical protein
VAISVDSNALAVCNAAIVSEQLRHVCCQVKRTHWQLRQERRVRSDFIFPWSCCSCRSSSMGSLDRGF